MELLKITIQACQALLPLAKAVVPGIVVPRLSVVPSGCWSSGVKGLVPTFPIPSLISTAVGILSHSWPPLPHLWNLLASTLRRLVPRHLDAMFLS